MDAIVVVVVLVEAWGKEGEERRCEEGQGRERREVEE